MLKSYVAFDIETTGLSPEHNEIIEIGALKVREGKVVDRFIRFIEPEAGIPPMITQLTGITNDMVEGAGNCGEVLPEFLEFCEQDTLIGHNVQFDFSFVKTKAKELGYTYDHMGYKVKKKEPITAKQIAFLTRLMQQKNISMEMDLHTLTKSEASREIDRILSRP